MRQDVALTERKTKAPPSDAELVRRLLREGGTEAFTVLVGRYKGMVMGRAFSILRDHHEAEDACQEAFVRAYRSLGQLAEPSGFAPWLGTIARNTALRRAGKRRPVPSEAVTDPDGQLELPATAEADPVLSAARRELYERALDEIEELPESYRSAVYLRYLKGHSCREITEIQGVAVGVVTSRLTRSTEQLRRRLAQLAT